VIDFDPSEHSDWIEKSMLSLYPDVE